MLQKACRTDCMLLIQDEMGHEMQKFFEHFLTPIKCFINKYRLLSSIKDMMNEEEIDY